MIGLFLKVLLTEFVAEMGDKTQLMLIAMTSKFKLKDIILGTAAAILVLNGLAVLAGGLVGSLIPDWLIKLIAAAAFMYFAATTIGDEEEDGENVKDSRFKLAPVAVFCTFFIAELGDKTQLTAITFGANEGLSSALIVWLGCSIGLFAADILGMMIGYLLNSKTPDGFLSLLAFCIFSVFGVLTLRTGLILLLGEGNKLILPVLVAIVILFVAICIYRFISNFRKAKHK